MSEEEKIVNVRSEIQNIAITPNSLLTTLTDNTNSTNPAQSKAIVAYVIAKSNALNTNINDTLNSYATKTHVETNYLKKTDAANTYLTQATINNLLDKNTADTYYAPKSHSHNDLVFNMYAHPTTTTEVVDNIVEAGYYQYTGSLATITCGPDTIHYKNGFIRVEVHNNHIIQHLYATSVSGSNYIINGEEYIRYGYKTGTNSYHWGPWYVKHIPYRERSDLINDGSIPNDIDNFTIYESTTGYTFKWSQSEDRYQLPMQQYQFYTIAEFTSLPIEEPYVFGNLIGHVDIKISKDSFKVRSTNREGEYVTGVSNTFFVPRTN